MPKLARSLWWSLAIFLAGIGLSVAGNISYWWSYLAASLWAMGTLFRENWVLKDRIAPKLRFVFDQDKRAPFVRDKNLYEGNQRVGTLRIFSVGIANDGAETAPNVTVRLMKIEPAELEPYWGSAMHVANEDKSVSHRDVHHATEPIIFFEVISQVFDGKTPTTSLRVRFGGESLFERTLTLRDRYFVTLAIDGLGAQQIKRYVIQTNDKRQYEMRTAWG